jgi:predicted transposase YdaD
LSTDAGLRGNPSGDAGLDAPRMRDARPLARRELAHSGPPGPSVGHEVANGRARPKRVALQAREIVEAGARECFWQHGRGMSSSARRRNRPHDKAFRSVFSRVEHALGVLRELVGPELAAQLDWSSLRVEPGTYVEEALRDLMSDLLFSARFHGSNRRALLYLLWDHQRQPDRMMPLRLHNYGGRALHDYTKTNDAIAGYVPTLVPLLVYQGPGEWPGPHTLSELSQLPGEPAPPVLVDLRMIVHELHDDSLPTAELTALARTTFRLLRLAALEQLVVANAARIAAWLDEVHDMHGYDDYRTLLEYIWSAGKDVGMIEAIIEHSREDVKSEAMSAAEWLREQGRAEGEAKLRALLLRQLELRFGAVPPPERAKVLEAEPEQVETWALRLPIAASLSEVFEGEPS